MVAEATDDAQSVPIESLAKLRPSDAQWVIPRLVTKAVRHLGWGVVDQAISSLTNFAVSAYIAHTLGVEQLGAFSLAYVTYGFVLNASRGLATDPLMVRYSGVSTQLWRRAVVSCTGIAIIVGLIASVGALAAAAAFTGTVRAAFIALGLTFPGLMLQDSWRFAFFVARRGGHAFLNDSIWAVTLLVALVLLSRTGHADVFWFTFAWGATACIAAMAGIAQTGGLVPRVTRAGKWLSQHSDLGIRYLFEGVSSSAVAQVRGYGTGLIVGLTAVGYVQASVTLMGPFTILSLGMGLVTIPEAARLLRRSPRHLLLFCVLVSAGLALAGVAWGAVLLVTVPQGLGSWLVGSVWRQLYPLELAQITFVAASGVSAGAGVGLHALGAARRSLRAVILTTLLTAVTTLAGAALGGAAGTVFGMAVGSWIGSVMIWMQFRKAYEEHKSAAVTARLGRIQGRGRHRRRRNA
jgi:O-antigen/teichoic acid export membrane protein